MRRRRMASASGIVLIMYNGQSDQLQLEVHVEHETYPERQNVRPKEELQQIEREACVFVQSRADRQPTVFIAQLVNRMVAACRDGNEPSDDQERTNTSNATY